MNSTHFFGIRIQGRLARFVGSVRDPEFQSLTQSGLPAGWVAWHIPDGETVENSERCRELARIPIVVLISGGLAAFAVPDRGPIESPYPAPLAADVLAGKFPGCFNGIEAQSC